jgi:hypothetical protein
MKSILDPTFVYVPSASTDIRKTFARARAQIAYTVELITPEEIEIGVPACRRELDPETEVRR